MKRIALDIDSTLHHYWDLLERVVKDRHGVELPYSEQRDWGITKLPPEDLRAAVMETHSDENIAAANALLSSRAAGPHVEDREAAAIARAERFEFVLVHRG